MSSDSYNDRQVWVINELSAMTLTSVRRFSTTSCLAEKMTLVKDLAPQSKIILRVYISKSTLSRLTVFLLKKTLSGNLFCRAVTLFLTRAPPWAQKKKQNKNESLHKAQQSMHYIAIYASL